MVFPAQLETDKHGVRYLTEDTSVRSGGESARCTHRVDNQGMIAIPEVVDWMWVGGPRKALCSGGRRRRVDLQAKLTKQ